MRILLLSLVLILLFAPVVSATDIFYMPNEISVKPGDAFDAVIWVSPTETIDTVATDLIYWNPEVMDCLSIEHGDLFKETTIWISGTIDNVKGQMTNMVWASSTPSSNSGVYVTLHFKAKKATATIVIVKEKCGVARLGEPVSFQIMNACVVNVGGVSAGVLSSDDAVYLIWAVGIFAVVVLLAAVYFSSHPKKKK